MKLKIYSTPTCPSCKKAKAFFKENGIEFDEVNVAEDEKERDEMFKKSGQMGVPVIEITRSNGGTEIIIGFDKKRLKQVIG
jgi:glutaredoxin 3